MSETAPEREPVRDPHGGDWLADYLEWKAENGLWDDGAGPVRPGEEPT